MKRIQSFLLIVALLVNACAKEAPEVDERYVGYWLNVSLECTPRLTIEADGEGTYTSKLPDSDCKNNTDHSGTTKIKRGRLYISGWHERITLSPTAIDSFDVDYDWMLGAGEHWSTMKMELSGATYYKLPH